MHMCVRLHGFLRQHSQSVEFNSRSQAYSICRNILNSNRCWSDSEDCMLSRNWRRWDDDVARSWLKQYEGTKCNKSTFKSLQTPEHSLTSADYIPAEARETTSSSNREYRAKFHSYPSNKAGKGVLMDIKYKCLEIEQVQATFTLKLKKTINLHLQDRDMLYFLGIRHRCLFSQLRIHMSYRWYVLYSVFHSTVHFVLCTLV